jgi:hypothetical protein
MLDLRTFLLTAFLVSPYIRSGFSPGCFFSSFASTSSSAPLAQTPSITPATTSECRRHSAYPNCARRTQGIHAARDPEIAEKAMHFFISTWIYSNNGPALLPPEFLPQRPRFSSPCLGRFSVQACLTVLRQASLSSPSFN